MANIYDKYKEVQGVLESIQMNQIKEANPKNRPNKRR